MEIRNNNEYEVKYNIVSNKNYFNEVIINDDYNLQLDLDAKSPSIHFKPLIKGKDIDIAYSIYFSFDTNIDLSRISNLKSLAHDGKIIYIDSKNINSKGNDLIKLI